VVIGIFIWRELAQQSSCVRVIG